MGPALADSKATPPTVETIVAGDGSVVSTQTVTSSGSGATTAAYSGTAPIKTTLLYTLNGQPASRDQLKGARGPVTATYRVQNQTGKAQDVTYLGGDGQMHTVSTVIQVPFVATVEATVPRSYSNLQADGASISTATDGTLHLSWSMVLFSPIGSPSQEATFSAQADGPSGLPGVIVRARPINPGANPALSGNARAANATQTQDDILHSLNGAADDGLTQLRTGVGTLVDGLTQLHDGSQQLSDGLATAAAGSQKLANGMRSADSGGRQLANGFNSPTGAPDLTSGSTALAAGLVLIDAGLAQLADPATGLPKAKAGSAALSVGVSTILAGLGTYSTSPVPNPPTILYGLKKSREGLTAIEAGITAPTGLIAGVAAEKGGDLCVKKVILDVADGVAAGTGDPCYPPSGVRPPQPGVVGIGNIVLHAVASKIGSTGDGTNATLVGGLNLINGGLLLTVGGLDAVNTGSTSGLGKVTGGLLLVKGGLSNPLCNPANPTDPLNPCGVLEGLTALNGGLTTAVGGVNQLHGGSTTAAAGANTLKGGIGTAGAGAATLAAGLDQLAAGADQLNAGVPTAVAGSNKITAGLGSAQVGAGQVSAGLADLQTKAVGPLGSQLLEGSSNARLELATIDATGERAASAPLGADATWLYRLDAVIPVEDSQTGRNLALGGGGLVLLLLGGGGGFLLGRRGRTTP